MSAISGIFLRRGTGAVPAGVLEASLAAQSHYGPDGRRSWKAGPAGLAFRWSDADSENEREALPHVDEVLGLVITADIRLDNCQELKATLGLGTTRLPSAALVLAAWKKWGRDSPKYLMGDYAFAIWDSRSEMMFCARDHIGARPLFYSLSSEFLVFATDIKGVLAAPCVSGRLDEDYVTAALADKRFYCKERTYLKAVRRLPPGHSLTVDVRGARLDRYWQPENARSIRFADDNQYADAARELLSRAVHDRARGTRNLGVHLSGGLDSSSITVLAARERQRLGLDPPVVLTGQPVPSTEALATPEYTRIETICASHNLSPLYCPTRPEDILEVLKKDPVHEPVNSTVRNEIAIQRVASERGVRLVLSGWGGDEGLSFDGRGYYSDLLLTGRWARLYKESREGGARWWFLAKEAALLLFADRSKGLRTLNSRSLQRRPPAVSFIHSSLRDKVKLHARTCRQTSVRSTLLWLWDRGYLAERIEAWAASGAHFGLGYAYPMLDRRLLEFIAGLPPEQFVRGKWRRYLMRRAAKGILPEDICWQPYKFEPERLSQSIAAAQQAVALAREELAAAPSLPSRARYLDMPRLFERMRPESLERDPKAGDLMRALQFLDF